MKKITYETDSYELYDMFGSAPKGTNLFVGIELKTGMITLSKKPSTSSKIANLGKFTLDSKVWVARFKKLIRDSLKLITKSHAMSVYGKKVVSATPVFMYLDNPYYKCAGAMTLYSPQMLDYYKKNL